MQDTQKNESYTEAKKVIVTGIFLNTFLTAYKIIVGYIGNSSAMVADGVHSLSDFLTDIIVLIGTKISTRPEDESHPYGHGKVETFTSLIIAVSLVIVATGILYNSLHNIITGRTLPVPKMMTLIAAFVSIIVKELLFRYTMHIGKKHRLNSLIANAWHHRSDAYSSIASMGGIIGAMMGFRFFDPLAAGLVAVLIGQVGISIGRDAFMDLIDTSADKKIRDKIEQLIRETGSIVSYHDLKTRKVGNSVISDLHIEVDPSISVVDGHNIARDLKAKITGSIMEVSDILIHVEPKGDKEGIIYHTDIDKDAIHKNSVEACKKIAGVLGLHSLKIHHFGSEIILNVDIEVDPHSTVVEGHKIAQKVKECLFNLNDDIKDVVVHIDPCNYDD